MGPLEKEVRRVVVSVNIKGSSDFLNPSGGTDYGNSGLVLRPGFEPGSRNRLGSFT